MFGAGPSGIGTGSGSDCCSSVGGDAAFSKSCAFTHGKKGSSSEQAGLRQASTVHSSKATYIYMHAGQTACILPRRRGLTELTEVVVQVRLRQSGSRG